MRKEPSPPPASRAVREPVQAYLAPDDSDLLNRLAEESGISKAEIIRRGIRSYAREQSGESPMLRFLTEGDAGQWPTAAAVDHDAMLMEEYRETRTTS